MSVQFTVKNARTGRSKLIPYVGCKAGFAHVFDSLIPDSYGKRIYDVFGGGGGFTFYACRRFGSKNVTYNDHNPVLVNLMRTLQESPDSLYEQYVMHSAKSSPEYFSSIRCCDLEDGVRGAGRFFYLAKNAFSGKIRFNSKNKFNCPMRKNSKCPLVDYESLVSLSDTISHLTITDWDFRRFDGTSSCFFYLDPPYMNNKNGHYNATVNPKVFAGFVGAIQKQNKVMISEQNTLDLMSDSYQIFTVSLQRSLQYITQTNSSEIIAVNYAVLPRATQVK